MRTSSETMQEIDRLLAEYEKEVNDAYKKGYLTNKSAATYVLHANHFVRWCRDDFTPGSMKMDKRPDER